MASAGKKLEDEEITSYILAGLDFDFNPTVFAMAACMEPLSLGELYTTMAHLQIQISMVAAEEKTVALAMSVVAVMAMAAAMEDVKHRTIAPLPTVLPVNYLVRKATWFYTT